jgi:hypothetical protein
MSRNPLHHPPPCGSLCGLCCANTCPRPRTLAFLSLFSLGGGYLTLKSRALAVKQRETGDYSVTVDRSGKYSLQAPSRVIQPKHQLPCGQGAGSLIRISSKTTNNCQVAVSEIQRTKWRCCIRIVALARLAWNCISLYWALF